MLLLTQFLISWIWAIELLFGLRWHGNNFYAGWPGSKVKLYLLIVDKSVYGAYVYMQDFWDAAAIAVTAALVSWFVKQYM